MSTFSYEKTYLPSLCSNIRSIQQKNRETLHCAGKDIYARAETFFPSKRGGSRRADAYHQVSGLASGWARLIILILHSRTLMIQCIWEPSKTELSFDGNFMFIQQQTW